jgi:catechol 2,3-dioxygenase-like lactoylglutathione lyase family enzyme
MFHTTAMVRDYEAARDALQRLTGLHVLEDSRIELPAIGRRGGLTWIGDNSLELGQPIVPGAGSDRFVARHGPGMHSIALQVEDMEGTCDHCEALGVRILPVSESVSFCHPKDTGGVFVEWYTGELPFDPRFGGDIPPCPATPAVEATGMAYAAAVVEDPLALAPRLAELFATSVTFTAPDATPGSPRAGVSLGDCSLALHDLPAGRSRELWGTKHPEPRIHALGVLVADLDDARRALEELDVAVVRDEGRSLVIRPAETGHVPLVVTDELLPGDPRR